MSLTYLLHNTILLVTFLAREIFDLYKILIFFFFFDCLFFRFFYKSLTVGHMITPTEFLAKIGLFVQKLLVTSLNIKKIAQKWGLYQKTDIFFFCYHSKKILHAYVNIYIREFNIYIVKLLLIVNNSVRWNLSVRFLSVCRFLSQ